MEGKVSEHGFSKQKTNNHIHHFEVELKYPRPYTIIIQGTSVHDLCNCHIKYQVPFHVPFSFPFGTPCLQ